MASALLVIADGSEEMEAIITYDYWCALALMSP